MKTVLPCLLIVLVFACVKHPVEGNHAHNTTDTIYINLSEIEKDSIIQQHKVIVDSLQELNDSLNAKLFVANYKLERVRYYCNVVDKKPTNIKYLKGWIRRVLE